jgi:hypothetical protein
MIGFGIVPLARGVTMVKTPGFDPHAVMSLQHSSGLKVALSRGGGVGTYFHLHEELVMQFLILVDPLEGTASLVGWSRGTLVLQIVDCPLQVSDLMLH